MSDPRYSFVYERQTADAAFHGIGARELVLSLLAGITPEREWDGCLVYEGESPLEEGTVCIGTSGEGSDTLQLRLLDAFESQGVRILGVYEGGPEPRLPVARAREGLWVAPKR